MHLIIYTIQDLDSILLKKTRSSLMQIVVKRILWGVSYESVWPIEFYFYSIVFDVVNRCFLFDITLSGSCWRNTDDFVPDTWF